MATNYSFSIPVTWYYVNRNGYSLLKKITTTILSLLLAFVMSSSASAQCSLTLTPAGIQNPSSCGAANGFFQVQVEGITAPYPYALYKSISGNYVLQENGTLIAGTLTFIGLTAGNYRVDVSKDGCSESAYVELTQPSLSLTATGIQHPSCGGTNGFFQVQATGIIAPYQYHLYKIVGGSPVLQENGTLIAGTLTFVGLGGGTYRVDVSKGGTCSGSITVELIPSELTMTPSNINNPTCGAEDGSFQVQTTGITAPYQYNLLKDVNGTFVSEENGTLIAGTLTFVGLSAGTYRVDVSKGGTCSGSTTTTLVEQPLTLSIGSLTFPTCDGANGSFSLQAVGIVPPYQYTLSKEINGSMVSQQNGTLIAGSPTFAGLSTGIYQVAISKNSCTEDIIVYMNCEVLGAEGCAQGYWKNHLQAWPVTNYSPAQTVESVFNVPDALGLDQVSLLDALNSTGESGTVGSAKILLRSAVAAVLNAASPGVDYSITLQKIITDVNTALASGKSKNMLSLALKLDGYNNKNCPLNNLPTVITQISNTKSSTENLPGVKDLKVKAYPNPSHAVFQVRIESSSNEMINVLVFDILGRVVEQRKQIAPNQTLQIGDNFIAGMYILEVQQGDTKKQFKLVKVR